MTSADIISDNIRLQRKDSVQYNLRFALLLLFQLQQLISQLMHSPGNALRLTETEQEARSTVRAPIEVRWSGVGMNGCAVLFHKTYVHPCNTVRTQYTALLDATEI
jgi:hypothetical protein